MRTAAEALRWLEREGIVLESARGAVPSLAATIAGETIRGSWWSHPKAQAIYAVAEGLRESDDVLVCRLVDGKITYVHRRLWPALVRLADRFEPRRIAAVRSVHTEKGHHESEETPFPRWVSADVMREAKAMSEEDAASALARVLSPRAKASRSRRKGPAAGS